MADLYERVGALEREVASLKARLTNLEPPPPQRGWVWLTTAPNWHALYLPDASGRNVPDYGQPLANVRLLDHHWMVSGVKIWPEQPTDDIASALRLIRSVLGRDVPDIQNG